MQTDELGRIYIARPDHFVTPPQQLVLALTFNYSVMMKLRTVGSVADDDGGEFAGYGIIVLVGLRR